ncbi:hypothetical protein [Desulforhopalus sp. IMCC35007]|uniref:hypothetical protein n=1 Tax=Desulforhopalus sp. IMCC35007 TaxID=2569543 RepID=UPI00145D76C7|nr:hypothetical protein [Desulforhopalus sp. IMCC35007]
MSLLQENIVYFWLIPVVFQICIPLAMLGGWLINKTLGVFLHKNLNPPLLLKSNTPI